MQTPQEAQRKEPPKKKIEGGIQFSGNSDEISTR
jgi:hypothetical protein